MAPQAVLFDFNGTLSDDEPVLYSIYAELFAEQGRPLSKRDYLDRLAGLSDEEIVAAWMGEGHPAIDEVIEQRVARYAERMVDGHSIYEPVRSALRYAAQRLPVGIVSGAARREIEPVVRAAGLADAISLVVSSDDVAAGKPHPEGYLRALELLPSGLRPRDVLVFEDTEAGVASAKAAGMRVIAVTGTLGADRLSQADALVDAIEPELVRRLLGEEADRP